MEMIEILEQINQSIAELLQGNNTFDLLAIMFTGIAAISAAIAAALSFKSVKRTKHLTEQQLKSEKPYFVFDPIQSTGYYKQGYCFFELAFANNGKRTAESCMIDQRLVKAKEFLTIYSNRIELHYDIPPDSTFVWKYKIRAIDENIVEYYCIFAILYEDQILGKCDPQLFALRWERGPTGRLADIFGYVSTEEYRTILHRFKNELYK